MRCQDRLAKTLALLNDGKLGDDWVRIRDTARQNVAKLEAALKALNVGVSGGGKVKFHWSSDEILHRRAAEYWPARHGRCSEVVTPAFLAPNKSPTKSRVISKPSR
jgi:hypothetical protein